MKASFVLAAVPVAVAQQRLIVDTDMGLDVDDAIAVCIANAMHKAGEVNLLAVVHDTGFPKGAGAISAINHWYGHDDIPIGAFKGNFGKDACNGCGGGLGQDQYLSALIDTYNPPIQDYNDVDDAVDVYRRVLAAAPDKSVNIASIGMLTNLKSLVQSEGDQHSSLNGHDLIAQKVDTIVYMDGGYNFGCGNGMIGDAEECYSSARDAVYAMPYGEITQLFSTLAGEIVTGKRLFDEGQCPNGQDSPCKTALANNHSPDGQGGAGGRASWDPFVTLIAARGLASAHATSHNVNVYIEPNGDETYPSTDNPGQQQVDYASGNVQGPITTEIDDLLCAAREFSMSNITLV
jgi:inosine-uridine nucleoside N-ribohydrolase